MKNVEKGQELQRNGKKYQKKEEKGENSKRAATYAISWRELVARDSVKIYYEVLGRGERNIVLANGLGGRLYSWEPLLKTLANQYRFLTWDYRGLFESEGPKRIRRLAIHEHAEDLREIMEREKIERASLIGWSMGVQVSLEFAALYPEKVEKLVLLNGTYGKVLETGFQPLFRIPKLNKFLHELIEYFYYKPDLVKKIGQAVLNARPLIRQIARLYSHLYRKPELEDMAIQYISDIFSTDFGNYLRLFQELDAHSVYHLLPEIDHPVLIISGLLDPLTPAYQSFEMEKKLPRAIHIPIPLGTHFVLIEFPQKVVPLIASFLEN